MLKAFKSSFPNTKPGFEITREVENIIRSLKPKNTYEYHGISSNLLNKALFMLAQFEIVYVICRHRMPETRTAKKIFKWTPLTTRPRGRPKYRWEDNIIPDLGQMKIKKIG